MKTTDKFIRDKGLYKMFAALTLGIPLINLRDFKKK